MKKQILLLMSACSGSFASYAKTDSFVDHMREIEKHFNEMHKEMFENFFSDVEDKKTEVATISHKFEAPEIKDHENNVTIKIKADVKDTKDIKISAEDNTLKIVVPSKDQQIELLIQDNMLWINNKHSQVQENAKNGKKSSSVSQSFSSRTEMLPAKLDINKTEAEYKDGALTIIIGKKASKKIAINIK